MLCKMCKIQNRKIGEDASESAYVTVQPVCKGEKCRMCAM